MTEPAINKRKLDGESLNSSSPALQTSTSTVMLSSSSKAKQSSTSTTMQPSTFTATQRSNPAMSLPSTRFDVNLSKKILLEVASTLVSENIIFGQTGREKFRQEYSEHFPGLQARHLRLDDFSKGESRTENQTTGNKGSESTSMKTQTTKKSKNTDSTAPSTPESSVTKKSSTATRLQPSREESLHDIGKKTQAVGTLVEKTSKVVNELLTTENINEDEQPNMDVTEVISIENEEDQLGLLKTSSTLENESSIQIPSHGADTTDFAVNPAASNAFESQESAARSEAGSKEADIGTQYDSNKAAQVSSPTAVGSQESILHEGLTEEQNKLWMHYIEKLDTDAIMLSKKGSRNTTYAMAKKDLKLGDFISHLRGRYLTETQAESIQASAATNVGLFALGRQFGNQYVDIRATTDWPGNNIPVREIGGNCSIMSLEKGHKTYYCFFATKSIKKGANIVYSP